MDSWWAGITQRPAALYSAAAMRIGLGLLFLVYLLRELPEATRLWGPDAAWTPARNQALAERADWAGWTKELYGLLATDSVWFFWCCYGLAVLVAVAFIAGWRTRAVSVVFALLVLVFFKRNVMVGDSSERVACILAVYLVFVACGRRWSLDARRATAASGHGEWEELRRRLVTLLHNAALGVIGVQMALIYCSAGLAKVRGDMWRDGTALYLQLQRDWWQPFPGLTGQSTDHLTLLLIAAYATVFVQLAFPFAVLSKWLKRPVLLIMLFFHVSIAVMMGLGYFSWGMAVGDLVFVSDGFWAGGLAWIARRRGEAPQEPGPSEESEEAEEAKAEVSVGST
ncbi:HTTM domain-containing protein [Streptomyces boninensis]|uniref:HTTM domain-containing protein n=1 Tax=Streptomyces boninensis TaxID=2039455 RepID=UPI003B20C825